MKLTTINELEYDKYGRYTDIHREHHNGRIRLFDDFDLCWNSTEDSIAFSYKVGEEVIERNNNFCKPIPIDSNDHSESYREPLEDVVLGSGLSSIALTIRRQFELNVIHYDELNEEYHIVLRECYLGGKELALDIVIPSIVRQFHRTRVKE